VVQAEPQILVLLGGHKVVQAVVLVPVSQQLTEMVATQQTATH
jgi:hypothetical protein